jgi:hypothetical protein
MERETGARRNRDDCGTPGWHHARKENRMKRFALVLFLGVLVVGGLSAAGAKDDPISGTWYGGSSSPDHAGFKYIYVFSPIADGRWQVLCFIASSPAAYGFPAIMTPFAGEIVKSATGYEMRILAMGTASANVPPTELPNVTGARAILTVAGPNEIKLVYDTAGMYAWGKTPFVDSPLGWAYRPGSGDPTPETIYKMQATVDINLK